MVVAVEYISKEESAGAKNAKHGVTGILRDFRLFGRGDVHDHAALEHLGQITVEFRTILRHEFPFVSTLLGIALHY